MTKICDLNIQAQINFAVDGESESGFVVNTCLPMNNFFA